MNNSSRLTKVVRVLVDKTGLDYVSLGNEIGASEKTIYKWMSGKQKISGQHFMALIELVGYDSFVCVMGAIEK